MIGIVQDWLFSLIGVNFNLDSLQDNNFFKDGYVLSDILKKYGLLSANYSSSFSKGSNNEECERNLKMLTPIFTMLKIPYTDKVILDILNNRHTTILKLLYEIYVCLENKQNLYFITQQNYDRVQQNTIKCLNEKIATVIVDPRKSDNNERFSYWCLEKPLIEKQDIIQWYKQQYETVKQNLTTRLNKIKEKNTGKQCYQKIQFGERKGYKCPCNCASRSDSQEAASLPDLECFMKSSYEQNLLSYDQYVAAFKAKQYRKSVETQVRNSIQNELIRKTWSRIMEKQNNIYNSIFSSILIKQSQYEKQLLSKLNQAQKQIKVQVDNQTETIKQVLNEEEKQINNDDQLKEDFEELKKIYELEQKRVLELHKKLYKEKQELVKKRHYNLCRDVLDSIVDIALNTSEYQTKYGVYVPKMLLDSWKQLFYKSQPVLMPFLKLESEELLSNDIDFDGVIDFEKGNNEVVTESDVDEYLYTCGRWFYENICMEYGNINDTILALIIHRLLSLKYPPQPPPVPAQLPHFNVSGVLLNFHGPEECIGNLNVLLSKQRIHAFSPEIAIKKCIATFLEETQPLKEKVAKQTESRNSKTTKKTKRHGSVNKKSKKGGKEVKSAKNKKGGRKKSKSVTKEINIDDENAEGKSFNLNDKETQTSLVKEDETKPVERTELGLIGEEVFKTLKDGQQVEEKLLVTVIIEYLKSIISDINGWVIINYPARIDQAAIIELALSGKYLPTKELGLDACLPIDDEISDENAEKRVSKIHPAPVFVNEASKFETYFSLMLKLNELGSLSNDVKNIEKPLNDLTQTEGTDEIGNIIIPEEESSDKLVDPIEICYKEQNVYREFEYETFDLNTLKKLARAILKEENFDKLNSIDLFGEDALSKFSKGKKKEKKVKSQGLDKKGKKNKKGDSKKKKKKDSSVKEIATSLIDAPSEKVLTLVDEADVISSNLNDVQEKVINPNDDEWKFVCLPLANDIAVILATAWENIEKYYLQNLKDFCFENRMISLSLVPYCTYVQKKIKEVAEKQDIRQDLVNVFKNYYSSLPHGLRAFPEVKAQLLCKILEMQQNIWQIIDKNKNDVEYKRQEIIYDNWLMNELCMLINNYIYLVQTEFDICIDTLKLVNDYYLCMLDKIPPIGLNFGSKQLRNNITRITPEDLSFKDARKLSDPNHEKIETPSINVSLQSGKNNFITESLIDCSENDETCPKLCGFLAKEIEHAKNNINALSASFYSQIKSEMDLAVSTTKKSGKQKHNDDRKSISKAKTEPKNKKKKAGVKNENVPPERRGGGSKETQHKLPITETNDITVHSERDLLIQEWTFVVDTVLREFEFRLELISSRAQEDITEFYCYTESVFCNIYNSNIAKYEADIENTNNLCDYLRTAVEEEDGLENTVILKKSEFYIYTHRESGDKGKLSTVIELLENKRDCFFTIDQLNKLLHIFKIAGPYGVIRKQPFCYILQDLMLFHSDDNQPHLPKTWNLLTEPQLQTVADQLFGPEYAVNWRDFIIYNLDIPYPTVEDILGHRQTFLCHDEENEEQVTSEIYDNTMLWFEKDLPENPQEGLRIALVKKILFDMFQVDEDKVNYTALLLYFCKDFDPADGLRKALCLSIGKNVITSKPELEELLREDIEIRQSVSNVLENIIASIVQNREGVLIYEISDSMSEMYKSPFNFEINSTVSDRSNATSSSYEDKEIAEEESRYDFEEEKSSRVTIQSPPEFQTVVPEPLVLDRPWVSRIPITAVSNVLNASFLHQDKTFYLRNQYLNGLEDEADDEGMIEGYVLMGLNNIQKLFTLTNKFKIVEPCKVVTQCLNKNS